MNGAAKKYDVVVVGAGVHGAGVAQAATAGGHSVLLIERSFPAYGTSSRSSKLIHGGLRYLESGQFGLVRESLRERTLMLRNAPDLVHLQSFYLPVYKNTRRRPWQLRLGLSLYAMLGGFGPGTAFGTIPRRQWDSLDGIETFGLQTVIRYHDGQTDDAALTRAIVASAQRLGAQIAMPAEFMHGELVPDGVQIQYREGGSPQEGREQSCHARVLINAAGPWAPQIIGRLSPALPTPALELVQGTHIILGGALSQGIYYVESPRDGRAVFIMPWKGCTLVGTTETRFRGNIDDVRPTAAEISYLQQITYRYFPRYRGTPVEASFAGLRVLPAGKDHAFHRPRETMIDVDRPDKPRVASIYGGKLTGWRSTSERVMHRIAASLPKRKVRADTRKHRLLIAD